MKKQFSARQGDIFIELVNEIPTNLKKKESNIIAVGESQNHAHAIFGEAEILEAENGDMFLSVTEETQLKHILMQSGIATETWTKEHKEITVAPGKYKVTIQRQYNPYEKAIEQVRD